MQKSMLVVLIAATATLGPARMAEGASNDVPAALGGRIPESSIAGAVQPIPLPNTAVFQGATQPARSDTLTITLSPGGKTEVMAVMAVNKVMVYSWKVDRGVVYVDFHGHSPDWANKKAFVRYLEARDGVAADSGSLVAPFSGEHGWFWENKQDRPATITLTVTGYHEAIRK